MTWIRKSLPCKKTNDFLKLVSDMNPKLCTGVFTITEYPPFCLFLYLFINLPSTDKTIKAKLKSQPPTPQQNSFLTYESTLH